MIFHKPSPAFQFSVKLMSLSDSLLRALDICSAVEIWSKRL